MNAVTAPKPQIMAGGTIAALIPQSLDEAFRVANAIAASGLAPKGLEKPEQVLVSIMAGAELGFAPFQSMQSFAVVNGKPSLWGDAIPALLWSRGFDIEEWYDDDDNATKAFCKVTRPSGKEVLRTFSIADAKKAGLQGKQGPWQTAQKRMLQMRARAFAARDGAADVLRGMQVYEEVQDYQQVRDVTPARTGLRARLEAAKTSSEGFDAAGVSAELDRTLNGDQIPDHDTVTGEVIDTSFPGDPAPPITGGGDAAGPPEPNGDEEKGPAADLVAWAEKLKEDIEGLNLDQIDTILASPNDLENFAALEATQPQVALDLNKAITRRRRELA